MIEGGKRMLERGQKLILMAMVVLIGIATVLLAVVATMLYLWDRENDGVVQSVADAGRVQKVSIVPGLTTRAVVETETGFYALGAGASLNKGEALQLQTRGNGRRYRNCEQDIRKLQTTLRVRESDCLIEVALPVRVAPLEAGWSPDLAAEAGSARTGSKIEKLERVTRRSIRRKGAP